MKYLLILLLFPFMSASDCGKKKDSGDPGKPTTADSLPICLRKIIDDAGKDIPPNTPEQIDEYLYKGKKTYLVTAHCCDQYNVLYDENCNMICAPSGGFTGKGDEKCPDFKDNSMHVKIIWKKPAQ